MKYLTYMLAGVAFAVVTATSLAEDPAAGCKCEMMKKDASMTTQEVQLPDAKAELDQLVTEMNSNVVLKKLEAMAAILTRLAQQGNAQPSAAQSVAPADATKSETHHH